MTEILPSGTTWLDVVTLAIALGTLVIALAALFLTVRRDRAVSKVGVSIRVRVDGTDLVVALTNTERRRVSIERAGVSSSRSVDGFTAWNGTNFRLGSHRMISDPALPATLEPGAPAYELRASMSSVKGRLFPGRAAWAWCVDSYGETRWQAVPEDVDSRIRAVRRRVYGPEDDYGQPTIVEINDDEDLGTQGLV